MTDFNHQCVIGQEEEDVMKKASAYLIVYSITDRSSFESASELRIRLRRLRQADDIPIILVGNKSDLVRSRDISIEGRTSLGLCRR